MGFFSRTALVTSPTVQISAAGQIPTLEEIHQHWNSIDAVGDQVFNDAVSALFAMAPQDEERG
jgi:hypothetical protein